jgi:hypothetical protein
MWIEGTACGQNHKAGWLTESGNDKNAQIFLRQMGFEPVTMQAKALTSILSTVPYLLYTEWVGTMKMLYTCI